MQLQNILVSTEEAKAMIESGAKLCIAGDEEAMTQLPKGDWIGGTIPYFMAEEGGCFSKEKVFVTDVTPVANNIKIHTFTSETISNFTNKRFSNGFTYIIVPGLSEIHSTYALLTHNMNDIMDQPVFGWVSGIDLAELGQKSPKIINGRDLEILDNEAIAMYIELPEEKTAQIDIINIFEQDKQSPTFIFKDSGFSAIECTIDGEEQNLKAFIEQTGTNTQLPLVADYSGAPINISFQGFDDKNSNTQFYAPVQKGIAYKLAYPIPNYIEKFASYAKNLDSDSIATSCNCILNYLYAELEGKKTGDIKGPITFGEIAYILVNQTLVYLRIE